MTSFWPGGLVHWGDVEPRERKVGHLSGRWRDLGSAAGAVSAGVKRIEVEPGKWSTPAHCEGAEEEIYYILGGSGLSWQDEQVYEIGEGDCIVHLPAAEVKTLRAGPDGLDVLAFGHSGLRPDRRASARGRRLARSDLGRDR
jgi:mannose-6-phosphate isomerase-like protein (cupin superfamily)